jgi:hypothetical protein
MRLDNVCLKEKNGVESKLQAGNFDLNHSSIRAATSDHFFSAAERSRWAVKVASNCSLSEADVQKNIETKTPRGSDDRHNTY